MPRPKRSKLQLLQIELANARKQHAKLTGEISREALRTVEEIDRLMTQLGGQLRILRLNAQLSQERVSIALGRKSNVMYRVEKMPQNLKLERYAKLLAIYGKTMTAVKILGFNPVKTVMPAATGR